jgi:adenine nucleotide transporter 17
VDAVAGAAGALLALLSTYPLMTLNTRQHTERGAETRARGGTRKHTRRRVSMMDELRAVAKEDGGLAGLYRGIEPAVIGTVTSQTVYNYVYASLRVATARMKNKGVREKNGAGAAGLGALESLAIASVAGSINVVLTIPIWTVCVRMQAERANEGEGKVSSPNAAERGAERDDDEKNDGVFSRTLRAFKARAAASSDGSVSSRASGSARGGGMDERGPPVRKKTFLETTGAVWEENGLAGFWRGVVPSLIMVSNPALQYAFYESASDAFRRRRAKTQRGVAGSSPSGTLGALTAWEVFVAASLAKMGATVLTYPVLLVKTRLQASGSRGGKKPKTTFAREAPSYDGAFDALRRIAREEGLAAFYRGMGTKMTQTVFAAALMFVTKEEIAKAARAASEKIAARRLRNAG